MNTPSKEVIDIFTKVTKHLLTQNAKAESFNKKTQHTDCCYLTPTGLKCAIGCLIKSDCYDPAIEGCTVSILHQDTPVSSKRQVYLDVKLIQCILLLQDHNNQI